MDYELIKLNIDRLHDAITNQHVVRYQYGDFNVKKEFHFRREGAFYYVEPYALIWQNDLYYLIGKFQETGEIRHYRLDRMRNIDVEADKFAKDRRFELQTYVDNTFHMYSGEEMYMEVRFHNSLLNAIFDRFGMDIMLRADGEDYFVVKAKAKFSDGLISWLLTWGHRAKVLGPEQLVGRMEEEVQLMAENYLTNEET